MKINFKNRNYNCPRLNDRVTLTLTYLHHQNDLSVPFSDHTINFHCIFKSLCG